MKFADVMKNPLLLISQETFLRRATTVVNLLLLCLLTYTVAELTWRFIPGPVSLPPPPPPVQAVVQSSSLKTWNIDRWNLFGVKQEIREPTKPAVAEIPETKLKLILRGIFASDDPKQGGAIIADPRNQENFYTVGSTVPGNAVLKEIYPDRVVLMRNNQFETLRLPKESVELQDGGSAASPPSSIPRSSRDSSSVINGAGLREYRDALVNNPQQIVNLVQISPKNEGGQFIGYEVQPGRDKSFLSRFGLQPGDVVTSVNGIELDTPAKGLNLLRSLPDTNEYRIELMRNGQRQSYVVNLD